MLARPDTKSFSRVSWLVTTLFLLLLSGPPKFRVRETEASLYGELDFVLILQIVIWLAAGAWTFWQLWQARRHRRPAVQVTVPHWFALGTIALLGASTATSLSPMLTAFKAYQVAVEFIFCLIFIEWYGVERFLDLLLKGCLLLCSMIAVCAVVVPDFVFAESETGAIRLEGRLIAEAGVVSAIALVLLLGSRRKRSALWLVLCLTLLVASLTRNAWAALAVFLLLAVIKRPRRLRMAPIVALFAIGIAAVIGGAQSELNRYRDPASIYTLSDRLGLWTYLTENTLARSPAMGLGYVAGARTLGPEYNEELGSGHSIFFEVFVGGGLVTLIAFFTLLALLGHHAFRTLRTQIDPTRFTVVALFASLLVMGAVGGELDSTPYAFAFWGMVCAIPLISPRTEATVRGRVTASAPLPTHS